MGVLSLHAEKLSFTGARRRRPKSFVAAHAITLANSAAKGMLSPKEKILRLLIVLAAPLAAAYHNRANSTGWPAADNSWEHPRDTSSFIRSRLSASNDTLLLDGTPILLRGATYSPTPIGTNWFTDFFVEEQRGIWERDLPLMRRMGANAVRVYELTADGDHTAFLDMCYALNITVIAGFPLDASRHDLRDTTSEVADLTQLNYNDLSLKDTKNLLRQAIEANRHPAIGMWTIGDEINKPINRFVCELEGYCKFWDEVVLAYTTLNELCGVVELAGYVSSAAQAQHSAISPTLSLSHPLAPSSLLCTPTTHRYLCTSPLADHALTNRCDDATNAPHTLSTRAYIPATTPRVPRNGDGATPLRARPMAEPVGAA